MSKRRKRKQDEPPRDEADDDKDDESADREEDYEEKQMTTNKAENGEEYEDEEESEDEENGGDVEKLLGKTVKALQTVSKTQDRIEQRLDRLEKDEPHPEDDVEFPDGQGDEAVEENPEEEEGSEPPEKYTDQETQRAADTTSSEPADDTTDEEESKIPKSAVTESQLEAILEKKLDQKKEELAKASTPVPPGFSDNDQVRDLFQKNRDDPVNMTVDLVEKAIQEDRSKSGGSFESSGRIGFRKGTEEDHYEVNQYLSKSYFGGTRGY